MPCECGDIYVDGGGDYLRMGIKDNGYGYINLDVNYDKWENTINIGPIDDGFNN